VTDAEATGEATQFITMVLPELWRAIPAFVLALLAFGFRRVTAGILGVFDRVDTIERKVDVHVENAGANFRANETQHAAFAAALVDTSARSDAGLSRVERAIEAQTRRVDELHKQR